MTTTVKKIKSERREVIGFGDGHICKRFTDISPNEFLRKLRCHRKRPENRIRNCVRGAIDSHAGTVYESDLAAVRDAGYNDREMLEIIAPTVQRSFTNYVSNAFELQSDFPTPES
jgi:hypothetical protein